MNIELPYVDHFISRLESGEEVNDVSRNIVPIFRALEATYTPGLDGARAKSATRAHRFFELSVRAKLSRFLIYLFESAS